MQLHILQMNSNVCLSHYSWLAALYQGKVGIYSKQTAVEVGRKKNVQAGEEILHLCSYKECRDSIGLAGAWQCPVQASHPDGKLEGSPSRAETPPAH